METKNEALELAKELDERSKYFSGSMERQMQSAVTLLRSQASEIERLGQELELARMKTYAVSISEIAAERDQLKAAGVLALRVLSDIDQQTDLRKMQHSPEMTMLQITNQAIDALRKAGVE